MKHQAPSPRMRGLAATLIVLSLLSAGCTTPTPTDPAPGAGEGLDALDRTLTPMNRSASEVSIAHDPTHARHLVAAANSDGGFGVYVSWDAGETWNATWVSPEDVANATDHPVGFLGLSDPVVAFAPDGTPYLAGLAYLPTSTVFVLESPDGGETWTTGSIVHESDVAGSFNDKEWLAVNPATGTLVVAWQQEPALDQLRGVEDQTGLDVDVGNIVVSRSTDGGETWTEPMEVDRGMHNNGTAIAFTPGGTAHLTWLNYEEGTLDHVTSTTDGETWTAPEPVAEVDLVEPYERYQRMHTLPGLSVGGPNGSTVAATWHDDRQGDADVLVAASFDGGETWTTKRVHHDEAGNGVIQFYPWVHVDAEGRIHASYYTSAPDPTHPRFRYAMQTAPAGTLDFGEMVYASNTTFTAFTAPNGSDEEHRSLGDYTSITVTEHGVFPAWADGRGNESKVHVARVALGSLG